VPNFAWALWPALFLSLAGNFLEFGLDPPGEGGVAWGWLLCAGVFFLMGVGHCSSRCPPSGGCSADGPLHRRP